MLILLEFKIQYNTEKYNTNQVKIPANIRKLKSLMKRDNLSAKKAALSREEVC